jgi:hypothetical protein
MTDRNWSGVQRGGSMPLIAIKCNAEVNPLCLVWEGLLPEIIF